MNFFRKPTESCTSLAAQLKAPQSARRRRDCAQQQCLVAFLAIASAILVAKAAEPVPNIVLWDTVAPLAKEAAVQDRSAWTVVPSDLLTLEKDPPKASSDPGYYGRAYAFKGDAVVENRHFAAVLRSGKGQLELYSKPEANPAELDPRLMPIGARIAELVPMGASKPPDATSRVELIRNAADEVVLQVFFASNNQSESSISFAFNKTEVIAVNPATPLRGITLRTAMAYGIAPSFVGDDLLFSPADYPAGNQLWIAAEHLFLGLLDGESAELVLIWPNGGQHLNVEPGAERQGGHVFESLNFENDGQPLYLAVVQAPGLWHRQVLDAGSLEKDVTVDWKRPFPAKWKTQLYEGSVKTSYAFRAGKGQIWRGVPGSYEYPAWLEGEQAMLHLSKKIPPKGESLIYFVEGQNTPPWISTPVDLLQASLGRAAAEPILDITGRKLRTHHRRGGAGVRRACTCGCTEAIQAVFEAGEEVPRKQEIADDLQDMVYFVHRHVERIDEYRRFADELANFLQASAKSEPALKDYCAGLEQSARQIGEEYSVQKENMKSFAYTDELVRQTLALTNQHDTNNVKAYMELLKAWRGMGGAQDYVVAQCHTVTRQLCQEAGYGAVISPAAVRVATQVRTRCRQILRNADGYEIWAEY